MAINKSQCNYYYRKFINIQWYAVDELVSVPSSKINVIAVILLKVFKNPVFSICAPKHPIDPVIAIKTPSISKRIETVLLILELIRYAPIYQL